VSWVVGWAVGVGMAAAGVVAIGVDRPAGLATVCEGEWAGEWWLVSMSMESNGFEIGAAAFGVVSGLLVALALVVVVGVVGVIVLGLVAAAAHAGSLRLESICGKPRDGSDGRNEDRRAGADADADGELIAAGSRPRSSGTAAESKWRFSQLTTHSPLAYITLYSFLFTHYRLHTI